MTPIDEDEYRSLLAARDERDQLEAAMVKLTDGLLVVQLHLDSASVDVHIADVKAHVHAALNKIEELQA